ncbi:ABC transporter permease [Staphylococcus agnetis]|uniref:ABC transporter permease n=1 Tax=Staphylococcus agnetis TaxID=985762 RepID=UPI00208F3257|nr:ABC transporter permease [Staphylococcus agnetis]MCO4327140.1 ABC transporter permease [Staphylococcus agnetis]MCO4368986.1 ABC transporter permease [Staphylococcus agnetis]
MRHISRWLAIPYILWMLIFIIIPVLLLCYFSFVDRNGHFSLENYQQFFTMRYMYMLGESILYAAIITAVCLMISYPAAYFIRQSKHAATWLLVMIIPTWMNLLLKTYAFIGIFSQDGLINRFMTALHLPSQSLLFTAPAFIMVSAYIYIPFMLLPIYNSMKDINNQLFYAAQDLGANTFTTMQKVLLPLSKEGIKTGIQVTFIPALSLFMITRLIAGNKVVNIGTAIEEQFLVIQNYSMGSTIALFLVLFMALLLIMTRTKSKGGASR